MRCGASVQRAIPDDAVLLTDAKSILSALCTALRRAASAAAPGRRRATRSSLSFVHLSAHAEV